MSRTFEWGIPLVAFCISGWMVAGYFAFSPGYIEYAPTVLPMLVPPTLYLYIALITNVIAWMIAAMFYIRGDEE